MISQIINPSAKYLMETTKPIMPTVMNPSNTTMVNLPTYLQLNNNLIKTDITILSLIIILIMAMIVSIIKLKHCNIV